MLEGERSIVQLQVLQRRTQVLEVLGLDGINTGKDHGLHLFESIDSLRTRAVYVGNGIAHLHLTRGLDTRNDIAYIAGQQFVARHHVQFEHPDFVGLILLARSYEFHLVAGPYTAVAYLEISDNSAERVEYRVENKTLQRGIYVTLGRLYPLDNGGENLLDTLPRLTAGPDNLFAFATQQLDNLVFHLVGAGALQVDFIDYRNNLQIVLDSHIEVRNRLCLNALRSIYNE